MSQVTLQQALRLHQQGDVAGAKRAYEAVLTSNPDELAALANLASLLARSGDPARALNYYRRALAVDDQVAALWFNYGNLCARQGDQECAEQAFRRAVELEPQLHSAWFNLGNLLRDTQRLEAAESCYRKTLALQPLLARAHTNLGNLLRKLERAGEAVECHQRARQLEPENPDICLNLGNAYKDLRHFAAAEASYQEGLWIQADHAGLLLAAGDMHLYHSRDEQALACWQRCIQAHPDNGDAYLKCGLLLYQAKQNEAAVRYLRKAVAAEPERADLLAKLGFTLTELGALEEAGSIARQLIARAPDHPETWMLNGFIQVQSANIREGLNAFERLLKIDPGAGTGISNRCFSSLYADFLSAEEVSALHRKLSKRITDVVQAHSLPLRRRQPGERIRVGYLSPDFRSHPVGFFMEPVLEQHDHEAFEIIAYALQSRVGDDLGQHLLDCCDHQRLCGDLNDQQLTERIRADDLDILVDLGGYTANCRMTVLARRVAPVQALYLGYPGTTGMAEMDWIIADHRLIPAAAEALYSERPARLPHSFLCFKPRPDTPDVAPLPALENGHITFGSYNNLPKLSSRCLTLWAKVLLAVKDSRLVLKALAFADAGIQAKVLKRFDELGVDADRIELLGPTVPVSRFLDSYRRMDIGLDTLPYNGGTTSCDALYMGVPVISLAGRHFYERMGASILGALGRTEWLASDEQGYVRAACELASDIQRLAAVRKGLRKEMQDSPLCDASGFTRALEDRYREMLQAKPKFKEASGL